MSETQDSIPSAAEKPVIPEPPGDGFPVGPDVSTPPPGSDQDESDGDEDE